ncbi:hypothetical protein EG329_002220 [Mollisiaceae sp. DMI_Dod_QoI]|nr:hypothetical protein EG329_002220 [Helotiales sp. DMI_Dod_QoI]
MAALASLFILTSAEPIPVRESEIAERQIVIQEYCCLPGCRTCGPFSCGAVCGPPLPSCCALAFRAKRDEYGVEEAYNQAGELVQFISPAETTPSAVDQPPVNTVAVAERQVIVEQYCCLPGCQLCTTDLCLGPDCDADVPWTSCCAIMVSGKRTESGAKEAYNQAGELVQFVGPAAELKAIAERQLSVD